MPTHAGEVRSFLGLVNYCARFIPHFAIVSEPLHQLTRTGTKWVWGKTEQRALSQLKDSLTSDCLMAHYNPEAETELRVDASPVGQEVRPVAYYYFIYLLNIILTR